jgi:hypothetical protein
MSGLFIFTFMRSRYLLSSVFGGMIGACCVLIVVYVTNARALEITAVNVNEAVSSLHTRINDFYIFAGIVVTLLLAINIGVFVRADDEVENHIRENFGKYENRIEGIYKRLREYDKQNQKTRRKNIPQG